MKAITLPCGKLYKLPDSIPIRQWMNRPAAPSDGTLSRTVRAAMKSALTTTPVLLHDLATPFYYGPAICFLPAALDAYVGAFRANGRR